MDDKPRIIVTKHASERWRQLYGGKRNDLVESFDESHPISSKKVCKLGFAIVSDTAYFVHPDIKVIFAVRHEDSRTIIITVLKPPFQKEPNHVKG